MIPESLVLSRASACADEDHKNSEFFFMFSMTVDQSYASWYHSPNVAVSVRPGDFKEVMLMNKAGIAKLTQVAIGLCGIEFPKRRVLGSSETACTSTIIVVFSPYRTDVPILHKSKVNIFICVVLGCSLAHDFCFFPSLYSSVAESSSLGH